MARELAGEFDRNYELIGERGEKRFLKVARGAAGDVPLAVRQAAIERVAASTTGLDLPTALSTPDGRPLVEVAARDGRPVHAVLTEWIEGTALAAYRPHDREVLTALGRGLGDVAAALADFQHPSLERSFDWELRQAPHVAASRAAFLVDGRKKALFDRHMARWAAFDSSRLPVQAIHGDANDYNVLVRLSGEEPRLALIDFGDMCYSWRVADLAIAAAYAVMDEDDPVEGLALMAAGYHARASLDESEVDAFPLLVALRLCVSVAVSAARAVAEPDDPYLVISERPAWDLLERLDQVHPRLAAGRIRAACSFDPSPAGSRVRAWLAAHGSLASPVLAPEPAPNPWRAPHASPAPEPDARRATHEVLDLSVGSCRLDEPFSIDDSTVGVGRYLEPRLAYTADQFASTTRGPERQRTIHLGIDLFSPAGTPVAAPFDAVVETVANHRAPLDYGPTVILLHPARDERPEFRTLYGHLHDDLDGRLKPGDVLAPGTAFASLGDKRENGGWPPHLHFQVIAETLDRRDGDFPGVAFTSQAAVWAALCPDPNLVLGINGPTTFGDEDAGQLLVRRRAVMGANLSVSYRRPLHIVRGRGAYLYDAEGRCYLDGVNNVAHVGHAHPRIVEAARRQIGVLNTNTRYLHPTMLEYAEALAGTFAPGLDVCFFVNSGSEANDLAMRMARTWTGRRGFIAVDGAYHGHLHDLIGISPYKFAGPGGRGRPDHVRIVRSPDPYRGPLRGDAPDLGSRYAVDVAHAAAELDEAGFGAAAFVSEAIMSCGGQIVPPPGWLPAAAGHARAAGALYIADEVQTGFGRVGTHWWAFEALGATPDIVTMGKPIGNGFPLGAVVTTRAIADAFANGMEYFNTYGGNPVSCAVGLEVLRVVREEGLMAHALSVGNRLLDGFGALADRSRWVGDVRGLGLFSGFELVRDPDGREPAAAEASRLVNRMRDLGVLLSTDGPDHNVVKVKPPLVISDVDADEMLSKLHDVLAETYFLRP